ncbi:DUF6672 family protein [uncultured Cetobacterium sp.]|uniref:DUF6672 family protein n=1 Tax=uncultured Cetobacterium sp. TaxID=527638 RepID=UPI00260839A9|nr:DUF6672 family protein [uncultured Cetobacterium sp.]
MKRIVILGLFFLGVLGIVYSLFVTGQNHTLIINNRFNEKGLSKNIVFQIEGYKDKKVRKNKKAIMNIKGKNKSFTLRIGDKKYIGKLKFSLNKGGELSIEKYLNDEIYFKDINQY